MDMVTVCRYDESVFIYALISNVVIFVNEWLSGNYN